MARATAAISSRPSPWSTHELMRELHLFAGAGGGILGGHLLGHTTVAAVEIEPYCQAVLRQRQADGILPPFPIFGDIREFDGNPWRGKVDVVAGGFPCTDISVAGGGAGIEGEHSGLWAEMYRVIREVQPGFVFVENSPALTIRGLGRVLWDLASMGFDAQWGVLGANFRGYDHRRERIWIVANSNSNRLEGWDYFTEKGQREGTIRSMAGLCEAQVRHDIPSPDSFGSPNGIPRRLERTKAIGNAQVPEMAAAMWRILSA
jgi:DNA (cytosine-5)-methyltransferase 1